MRTTRCLALCVVSLLSAVPAAAQQSTGRPTMAKAETKARPTAEEARKARQIRSALAAGPRVVSKDAAVMAAGADGKMVELRPGTNGWTCIPDEPQTPGTDPMCIDRQGMMWVQSLMNHDAKPANTQPGIIYMLQGGSDISATDPFQTKTEHYIASPPHWMILWQPDSTSGLPTTPKKTGTWIMWAGTPYAHLMINQVP